MLNAKGENVVKWILVSLHANWLFSGKEISLLQELRNVPHFHADSGHRWAKNHIKIYIPMIIYTNTTGFLRNKNWNHDITLLFLLFFLTRVSVFFTLGQSRLILSKFSIPKSWVDERCLDFLGFLQDWDGNV